MIPDSAVLQAIKLYSEHRASGCTELDAMRKALDTALNDICQCGVPLMLGVTHHKHVACEVPK